MYMYFSVQYTVLASYRVVHFFVVEIVKSYARTYNAHTYIDINTPYNTGMPTV